MKIKKYIYFSLIYVAAVFLLLYFGNKFFTMGTEPGTALFKSYADQVFLGKIPYHDFLFEYPPLTILFLLIPRFFSANFFTYQLIFWLELSIFGLVGLWITINLLNVKKVSILEKNLIPLLYIALIFALGILNFSRYDMIPAVLTLGAVWFKIKNKPYWAYFILGLAVATKIYPAVVLPLFLIEDYGDWKKMIKNMLFFIGGIFLSLLPFIMHLSDLKVFITYQSERGVQIESLWANILMVKHFFSNNGLHIITEAGALGLSPYPKYFTGLSYYLSVIFLFLSYWLFSKTKRDLILYSFLAILIFMVFNRVFSPQYFIWLIVFFPLIMNQKIMMLCLTGCFFLATVITRNIYPNLYTDNTLLGFKISSIILLSTRNLALILILFTLIINQIVKNQRVEPINLPKDSVLHRG